MTARAVRISGELESCPSFALTSPPSRMSRFRPSHLPTIDVAEPLDAAACCEALAEYLETAEARMIANRRGVAKDPPRIAGNRSDLSRTAATVLLQRSLN